MIVSFNSCALAYCYNDINNAQQPYTLKFFISEDPDEGKEALRALHACDKLAAKVTGSDAGIVRLCVCVCVCV